MYQWDSLHGEIEVYNKRGVHLNVFDINGYPIKGKGGIKGRRLKID